MMEKITPARNKRFLSFLILFLFLFLIIAIRSIFFIAGSLNDSTVLHHNEKHAILKHRTGPSDKVEDIGGGAIEELNEKEIFSAFQYITDRKESYRVGNKTYVWPLRGIGFLHERHDVVLLGKLSTSHTNMQNAGRKYVHIHNVKNPVNCSMITIWVRVNGPEIFAGHAYPVLRDGNRMDDNQDCYWEFEFDAKKSGLYTVDAKVLEWNPVAAVESDGPVTCTMNSTASLVDLFPIRESFIGFKMYYPESMCCEICSRLVGHCRAWSNPIPAFPMNTAPRRGCTLYFTNTSDYAIPYSAMLNGRLKDEAYKSDGESAMITYGLPHDRPTSYFIGCGWSYWFTLDFPCLSPLDDSVFFTNNMYILPNASAEDISLLPTDGGADISAIKEETISSGQVQSQVQPKSLCTLNTESFTEHRGRWVREPWPTYQECPHLMEEDPNVTMFNIVKFDGKNPHCWHRDDFSVIGGRCMEANCALIKKDSLWRSSIHEEKQWYGRWQHDSGCSYAEFTDDQLQSCVDRRKLYGFQVDGKSIATFLRQYMNQRLNNIKLYDNDRYGDGTRVTLSTFGILHYCHGATHDLRNTFQYERNISALPNEDFFWVSGYFLSSERELLCTASRMEQFNLLGERILQPKGYKMINAFDMSAAFTYDTATQNDGMHIIGPTMKMIITKLFHYLCFDDEHSVQD